MYIIIICSFLLDPPNKYNFLCQSTSGFDEEDLAMVA